MIKARRILQLHDQCGQDASEEIRMLKREFAFQLLDEEESQSDDIG
jgi:hypothetical protein